jgi:hypothetical protein
MRRPHRFLEILVLMPMVVCPNCVYFRLGGSFCISGLSRWSRRVAKQHESSNFAERARGPLCSNNLHLIALIFPIVGVIPGLTLHFSLSVLVTLALLVTLLVFRFLVIFPRVACVHCRAKDACPNAQSMGLPDVGATAPE